MRDVAIYPAKWILERENPKLELIDRRTEKSKTFLVAVDKKTYSAKVVVDITPIHYEKDKKWEEINLTFVRKNGEIIMEKASYRIKILKGKIGYKVKFFDGSWYRLELVKIGTEKISNFKTHFTGNQYFWDNVSKDVDIKLQLHPAKPAIYTQIKSELAQRVFVWKITESKEFNYMSLGGDMDQNSLEVLVIKSKKKNKTFYYQETWTGRVSRIMDKRTRIRHWEEKPFFPLAFEMVSNYPVYIDPTITKTVAANADDGREETRIATWHTNTAKIGQSRSFSAAALNGGFRFTSVNIPAGATITAANLKLKVKSKNLHNAKGKVYADKVGNAAAWSSTSRPSQITKTTAGTLLTITQAAGHTFSVNVKTQVASVVGLAGWASNNAMRFAFLASNQFTTATAVVYDHNTSTTKCAKLVVTYTGGGGGTQYYSFLPTLGAN